MMTYCYNQDVTNNAEYKKHTNKKSIRWQLQIGKNTLFGLTIDIKKK